VEFGLWGMNIGTCADPAAAVRVARAAEEAGLESLWTGEHVVLPSPQPAGFPMAPDLPWLDSIAGLTLIAAVTDRIRIASGTIEVPLHQAVRLAKALASVDVVSGGRLIAGLGLGYVDVEFDALGVDRTTRGLRMDEGLDAMQELWTGDDPTYAGETVSFSAIGFHPRPVQPGGPPIVLGGGGTPRARQRIIERAHGWYLFGTTLAQTADSLAAITEEQEQVERPDHLGPLEITVTPAEVLDAAVVRAYEDLGVHRLVLMPAPDEPADRRLMAVPEDRIHLTIERLAALV
jgi:probable F420-dependent oxidoreductase